jgi:hypothetical protein
MVLLPERIGVPQTACRYLDSKYSTAKIKISAEFELTTIYLVGKMYMYLLEIMYFVSSGGLTI